MNDPSVPPPSDNHVPITEKRTWTAAYVMSFLFPPIGLTLWLLLYPKSDKALRRAGGDCLILAVLSTMLVVYLAWPAWSPLFQGRTSSGGSGGDTRVWADTSTPDEAPETKPVTLYHPAVPQLDILDEYIGPAGGTADFQNAVPIAAWVEVEPMENATPEPIVTLPDGVRGEDAYFIISNTGPKDLADVQLYICKNDSTDQRVLASAWAVIDELPAFRRQAYCITYRWDKDAMPEGDAVFHYRVFRLKELPRTE